MFRPFFDKTKGDDASDVEDSKKSTLGDSSESLGNRTLEEPTTAHPQRLIRSSSSDHTDAASRQPSFPPFSLINCGLSSPPLPSQSTTAEEEEEETSVLYCTVMAISSSSVTSFFLLLCLAVVIVAPSFLSAARPATWTGGRTAVTGVQTNAEIQELGRFSVEEHNRKRNAHVAFRRVVEAQRQVVSGIEYYLRIEAEEGGSVRLFDAAVVVKAWLRSRELVPRIDSNVEVQELGRFSVEEHNRREHAHLAFQRVVEAQRQVVSGVKYYLRIEAEEGGDPRLFNAAVVVKAWLRSVELVSFESSV
ncbi:Multicystatin [Nymphaea thermarum]|nr:Multicystatin [Nymphaea thermarum]